MGKGVAFGGDENVLKCIVVMGALLCEYTKNQGIVHFTQVNYRVCELYLYKAVTKNKAGGGGWYGAECGSGTSRNHYILRLDCSGLPRLWQGDC